MDRQETNRENTKIHEIKKKKLYLLDSSNNTEENEDVKKGGAKILACRFTFKQYAFPRIFKKAQSVVAYNQILVSSNS